MPVPLTRPCLGILVAPYEAPIPPPCAFPLGRAALRLARDGQRVVFGYRLEAGRLIGYRPVSGTWVPGAFPVDVLYDRFPSRTRPEGYAALLAARGILPMGNPHGFTQLLRDKPAFQALMATRGIPMPEIVCDPKAFDAALEGFGAGFVKPRIGGRRRGVVRVEAGAPLSDVIEGAFPGGVEPLLLQRAVSPPSGWAGLCVQMLLQRSAEGEGAWIITGKVARGSRIDPLVHRSAGATMAPAEELLPFACCWQLDFLARQVLWALEDLPEWEWVVEFSLGFAVDAAYNPVLIEAKAHPRSRLQGLALARPEAFGEAHVEACARPMRYLLSLAARPGLEAHRAECSSLSQP